MVSINSRVVVNRTACSTRILVACKLLEIRDIDDFAVRVGPIGCCEGEGVFVSTDS